MAIRRTVAVASGKGGVGKSTVSLNLALALAADGRAVGLLDADLYGPDIALMIGLTRRRPAKSVNVWQKAATRIEPLEHLGIQVMSMQFLVAEDQALAWSRPMVELLLHRFNTQLDWGDLDVLVVDLPPGTADVQQLVTERMGLHAAVLVVTPQDVAHLDAKKVIAMFQASGVEILGAVENMTAMACPNCSEAIDVFPRVRVERSLWAQGVACLARVPLDPAVAAAGDGGTPVVLAHPESAAAVAFRRLGELVADGLAL